MSVLSILFKLLKIKVTKITINKTDSISGNITMKSLSDFLSDYNIDSLAVKIAKDQLHEIPYPAVAHFNRNSGHFVVLIQFANDQLHYIDPEIGLMKESISDFEKKWTGVVLLVEANEKSGEELYKEKRRQELFGQWSNYLVWTLSLVFLILPLFFISLSVIPYYLLKIFGLAFCVMLLQKQFGSANEAISSFCGLGSKSNCDAVIHSPGSKLLGIISLSEIGSLYFAGGVITLMISAFAGISISGLMITLTFLLVPFTLVSVYYQWRVVKAWCPLCLVVMLVIWQEAMSLVPLLPSVSFEIKSLIISVLGFSLPLVFWLTIRERFMDSYRLPNLERSLYRFTRSDQVFQSLLYKQPKIDNGKFSHEIKSGSTEAPVIITLVSNPNCGPCIVAHAAVEDLLECFEDKIKIEFRFAVNPHEPEANSTKMVKHLIALSLTDSKKSMQALSSWYLQGGRMDINQWISKFPAQEFDGEEGKVNQILSEHANWCKRAGIASTPALFINGMKYPDEYTLNDLKFQIRRLLESFPDHAPKPVS